MTVPTLTPEQLLEAADTVGLSLTEADVTSYLGLIKPYIDAYRLVDAMPDNLPEVKYPRSPGRFPSARENPRNAWYVKTSIKGAAGGKLSGRKVAIKDNVMVAGVPMMNGNSILEGYVPDVDATIVTRILDAGGEIVGKTHCEDYCISGGSHTGAKGPVHNPYKMGYSAGGSSSGSGVVVALGEADMAIGGDQGGSIRMPSSWCGIVGMKPTHGLVPYTGIMPIEVFVDHTGPMTANVKDNATLLEVLAGVDGYDPRQYHVRQAGTLDYTSRITEGVRGMKIGLVKEGFAHPNSEPDSDAKVRSAAEQLKGLGAMVEEVSIPEHLLGPAIWTPIGIEGIAQTMMFGDGYGLSRQDLYVTSLIDKLHGWELRADQLSETTKILTVVGVHMKKHYGSRFYGKAVNLSRQITAAYDAALAKYDLLLMPTMPLKATPLPPPDAPRELYIQRALEMIGNTCPFDITHHPAMTVPCGMSDDLPVGMMLIGKHFDEATIYRAGYAFEQSGDWKKR
ncbi:MAG: amidase [Betaproteobacteria bacterium]|nr:amidase [Betaproteobacteria bacterium]